MAGITFIGDPRDGSGPDTIVMHGVTFLKGRQVQVDDPIAIAKCSNNAHFRVDGVTLIAAPKTTAADPIVPRRRGRPPKVRADDSHD